MAIVATSIDAADAKPKSRIMLLVTLLNVILLGWLLYTTFVRPLTPSGGSMIAIINDTPSPMIDMSFSYPGGNLPIGRVDPKQSVGSPVQNPGEYDATLTFKDEAGHAYREDFHIKPIDELLIKIYVLPVWEEAMVKTADGTEEKVFKRSRSRVRILPSYQGENLGI